MRLDKTGTHRAAYERNRKRILKTQNTCGICGYPVDVTLKPPNPMAPVVDHIIPISKHGHPSSLDNLQLAHANCNRQKSDKLFKNEESMVKDKKVMGNRNLPQSRDWIVFEV